MKKNVVLIEKSNIVFCLLKDRLKNYFKNKINVMRYDDFSQCNEINCDLYIYDYENPKEDFQGFLNFLNNNVKKSAVIFSSILNDEGCISLNNFNNKYIKFSKYEDINTKIDETLKMNK